MLEKLKGIKRIVKIVDSDTTGPAQLTVFKSKRKRKKGSKALRPMEKMLRRAVKSQSVFGASYLDRHMKSASKKRDGWLRDLSYNIMRAGVRSARVLRP